MGSLGGSVSRVIERLILAQVMISWFVSSSPTSGSVLTARSLGPASDSVSPCLSLCPSPAHTLSLSLSKMNKHWGEEGGVGGRWVHRVLLIT